MKNSAPWANFSLERSFQFASHFPDTHFSPLTLLIDPVLPSRPLSTLPRIPIALPLALI
jgi:hypothetical protein